MQGEKGSLRELQRYHRGHHGAHPPSASPRATPPRLEPELGTLEEGEESLSESPTPESDMKALRALQAKLLLGSAPPVSVVRSRGGRRHTLANLSR